VRELHASEAEALDGALRQDFEPWSGATNFRASRFGGRTVSKSRSNARPDEKLAQRLDNTPVDRRRGDPARRGLILSVLLFSPHGDGMPTSPCDQSGNVGVRDLV
jgi:hypothetical protein